MYRDLLSRFHNFGVSRMAKKLPWGSFSHEDLLPDHEDDIYQNFPFLNFIGMLMVKINELRIGDNAVRSIQDTISQKIVGLTGSLFNGWDRSSWPIPFVRIETEDTQDKEAFDRRHTIKVCRGFKHVDEVPGAEYERSFPENGGVFNNFDMNSILTMAAMWGNVYGPIVEDTKEHNYETACVNILSVEQEKTDENLLTKSFVRSLLKYMGCYTRYNDNLQVINRIAGRVLDALKDPENVSGKLAINNNKNSVDEFIKDSNDWQSHNTENDNFFFEVITIQDNDSFAHTYAEKLLTRVCNRENKEATKGKITKVLLYNESNSNNPKKIVASRLKFKERLNSSWTSRRDNILNPVLSLFNFPIHVKKLSDLNLEIWNMNQVEDEDEPFEMAFDKEEG